MKRRRITQRAFLNVRTSIAVLLCAAASCWVLSATVLAFFRPEAAAKVRTLSFSERVAYQRAIEDVYWRHRIWPKERPDRKPSLDAVMSEAQLEKKVQDYLRKSQRLQDYYQHPITAEQLQAEMDRMARHTKQPEVLRELFEALGNDPFVIAECLARPVLAERLLTNLYGHNQEPLQSRRATPENQMPKLIAAPTATYTVPRISDGSACIDDTWTATTTTNAPSIRAGHTAVWTGSEMIVWGGYYNTFFLNTGGRYDPATDSWTATTTMNAPSARYAHTAVWTGSEMIVWAGSGCISGCFSATGGRYNPSTDSWTASSTTDAPSARYFHTAIWIGSEMIVWGGAIVGGNINTGGRYNPDTDSWIATSTDNAPSPRAAHTAVWTGSEMIVWGGAIVGGNINTGGRYNPDTDSWIATNTTNAPSARSYHTAIWTGNEMIAWGGAGNGGYLNTGGRYNPSTDSWAVSTSTNAPSARYLHTAVWTGSEMIVWGGEDNGNLFNTGGRYNSNTDDWIATSTTNAPSAREVHTAAWTGSEMIIWGGYNFPAYFDTGGRYCATAPSPTPTPTPTATATATPSPTARPTPVPRPRPTAAPRP